MLERNVLARVLNLEKTVPDAKTRPRESAFWTVFIDSRRLKRLIAPDF
jgi:hypothetical protein